MVLKNNSVTLNLAVPVKTLSEIQSKLSTWMGKKSATKRELQSLAGTIAWGAKCIRAIRPILRNVINLYKGLKSPNHHARLPSCIKSDILFLIELCKKLNGVPFAN